MSGKVKGKFVPLNEKDGDVPEETEPFSQFTSVPAKRERVKVNPFKVLAIVVVSVAVVAGV